MYRSSAIVGLFVVIMVGCQDPLPPVPEPEARPIKTLTISNSNQSVIRAFPATLEAGDKAVLAFRVSGIIDELPVRSGQRVEKDDLLIRINPDELTLLKAQAQANYNLAYVQFKRDEKLLKTNVVSELQYDTSKANLNEAKAGLDQAETNLSYAELHAPYGGNISLVLVENYQYVSAKEAVMNIQSSELINVVFQLPEGLLSRFKKGVDFPTATVSLDTRPGEVFQAMFKEIDTEITDNNASYQVTMVMERPEDKNILPGMAGTLNLVMPSSTNTKIPEKAIFERAGSLYVWRINIDGNIEETAITLDSQGRILTGLIDGDMIAISGVELLSAGQKVYPWVQERGI